MTSQFLRFIKKLSPDDLNIIVMKQNLTVSTMFECVLFSQDTSSGGMGEFRSKFYISIVNKNTAIVLGLNQILHHFSNK